MKNSINKKTNILFFSLIFLTFHSAKAQSNEASSFLEKLYFPFDFGYTLPIDKNMNSGGLIKTGLEFRIKKEQGFFIRFNFDNRTNNFNIKENQTTNVVVGKIKFDDYVIGAGYRLGDNKIKVFRLCQGGISTFNFPTIIGSTNNFMLDEQEKSMPVIKLTLGFEYYVAQNAALTIETGYILHTTNTVFWNKKFSIFGLSVGLTTTLF